MIVLSNRPCANLAIEGIEPVPLSSSLKTMSKIFFVSESQMDPMDQMQEKKKMPSEWREFEKNWNKFAVRLKEMKPVM
jgi:hypothetical protein